MNRPPTPVEVWAPAFEWLGDLTVDNVCPPPASWDHDQRAYCRLCERRVPVSEREAHVREHRRERASWRKSRTRTHERAARTRLRTINRERRLERRVLNGSSS